MRLLIALLTLFWSGSAYGADWREAETAHFRIVSSGSEVELRKFAERLEQFHSLLGLATGANEASRRMVKVRVFLVPSIGYVQKLYGGQQSGVAGFYDPRNDGAVAVVPRSTGDGTFTGQLVLFHEYAHHYMLQYSPAAYPSWYIEGFAEIASTASFERKGAITFGKAASHRQYELVLGDRYPAAKMLDGTYLSDQKRGRGWSYGDAWLLSHYLTFTATRPGQFRAYMTAINAGKKPIEAAQVFGDLASVQREVSIYLAGRSFPYRAVPIAEISSDAIKVRVIGATEAALIDQTIEIERRTRLPEKPDEADQTDANKKRIADFPGRLTEARLKREEWLGRLEVQVNRLAGEPAAWRLLADARCASEQYAACATAAERALALRPGDGHALTRRAEATIALATALTPEQRDAKIAAVQEDLLNANAANPDDPLPLLTFYRSFAAMGRPADADGLAALVTVVQLVPQVEESRLMLGHELMARARWRDARIILRPLAFSPHENGAVRKARTMIDEIEAKLEPAS